MSSWYKLNFLPIIFLLAISTLAKAQEHINSVDFQSPPQSSRVHTWWHWMNNGITIEGITKDLESMQQQGVVQATILNVGLPIVKVVDVPDVNFGTPEWYEMFHWALTEANRVGISIGVHNCDGWSTSGGPWVSADESMKRFVWSKTTIQGGKELNILLPEPPNSHDYYRDYAVVAFPVYETENSFQSAKSKITINKGADAKEISDGNPYSSVIVNVGDVIDIELKSTISINKVSFYSFILDSFKSWLWGDPDQIGGRFILYASKNNVNFQKVSDLDFRGISETKSIAIPKTEARYFRLECLESTNNYPLSELELLRSNENPTYNPVIPKLLEKTGATNLTQDTDFDLMHNNISSKISEEDVIDLSDKMDSDGLLNWTAPGGNWKIIRFGYTTTERQNNPSTEFGRGYEVDKMDSTALNHHFNGFGKKLVQKAGEFTGNTFKFLLIDSWEAGFQNWTKSFPVEFENRRGYNIIPWIPVLCGEVIEDTKMSEGFLFDFQQTISDLIGDNYYKHFSDLCHRNDLEMHAEVIYGERGMYPAIDVLKANNYPDMVMSEFWAMDFQSENRNYQASEKPRSRLPLFTGFEGKQQIIASEAYTGLAHYSESPFELKPWGDEAFCSGVNQMILHSYVHQSVEDKPGVTLWKFGASFNRNNPWWEFSKDWLEYQSRIQYVLQKGEPAVDVVYYVGDQLPQSFYKSVNDLMPYGYVAYPCNFEMLLNQAKVVDGKLSFGGSQKYAFLALPDKTNMQLATLKQIAKLVKEGLVIYGPKPEKLLSLNDIKFNSDEFNRLADELWGKGKVVWGKPINELLEELEVVPGFNTNISDPKEIMFIHKKVGRDDVFFVFNQQNRSLNRELLFRTTNKSPEIWNAEDGRIIKPAVFSQEGEQIRIPVSLEARQSLMFVFRETPGVGKHINQVYMGEKQIFPLADISDTLFTLPKATLVNDDIVIKSEQTNDYTFLSNRGDTIRRFLIKPDVFEIKNFKGSMDFLPIYDEVLESIDISVLKSLTEFDNPSIKYFAGKVKYTIEFVAPKGMAKNSSDVYLNLGKLDAAAEVNLNGKHLVYNWIPGAKIPVSGLIEKKNTLEITVATVCRNRFIGDYIQHGEVRTLWTTTTVDKFFDKDKALKPSGLMGPIQLIQYGSDSQTFARKSTVTIKGDQFYINGKPSYEGRYWKGHKVEGLLLNSRMVQGIFDDIDTTTSGSYAYPDTKLWDAERNNHEFVEAMSLWHSYGLNSFTLNMQGGSPVGYQGIPYTNPGFHRDGSLMEPYMQRLDRILKKADELEMVVILGIFYFRQDEYLRDEAAIKNATGNLIDWLFEKGYRNVIIEICNETNSKLYDHESLKPERIHELIKMVKKKRKNGYRYLVGTSFGGVTVPASKVVKVSDFLLIHGNGAKNPEQLIKLAEDTRNVKGYRKMPIVNNEDDHFDFDKNTNNFTTSIETYVSWGYLDFRFPGETDYEEGYQSVPVDWGINSERKKGFFSLVKEITGGNTK